MPTYDYACEACGHGFEAEQRISEDPLRKCPKCGKQKLKRLIAGGGTFILKGGGWYADLYSSTKPDKAAADSASAEGGAGAKTESTEGATKAETSAATEKVAPSGEKPKSEPKPKAKKAKKTA